MHGARAEHEDDRQGPLIESDIGEGVALLTLDRPEKRNALSIELRRELARALAAAAADERVRATVLTGRGSAFCAGMDTGQFGGDEANRRALVESTEQWLQALRGHPKPLIAAVNGPAVGGGFVLALLCDIRIAGASARFGFPELARGIPASYGAARAALARAAAAELALTGRIVGAEEALRLGIVSAVVEDEHLLEAAGERARWIARLPERGVATTLEWVRSDRGDFSTLLAAEQAAFHAQLLREPE